MTVTAKTQQEITTHLKKFPFIEEVTECNGGWIIALKQGTKSPATIYTIITTYILGLQGFKVIALDHEWTEIHSYASVLKEFKEIVQ